MYRIKLSIDIAAPVERVWRALCDPAEVVRWDSGVTSAIDAPADYPQPGQHVRWSLRSTGQMLDDRPQEVVSSQKLRSLLSVGPTEIDETYLLSSTETGCLVDVIVDVRVRALWFAAALERLFTGPRTRRDFAASLAGLKRHCEM